VPEGGARPEVDLLPLIGTGTPGTFVRAGEAEPLLCYSSAGLQLNVASITAQVAMALPAVVNAPYFV
jgi:hypothetical protein